MLNQGSTSGFIPGFRIKSGMTKLEEDYYLYYDFEAYTSDKLS